MVSTHLCFRVSKEVMQEPGFLAFLDPSRVQLHGIRPLRARTYASKRGSRRSDLWPGV